jgi:hypothetical protein
LAYELYRVGHRAFLGGHSGAKREVDLPGGLCPKTEWALEPEKIEPFAEALKRGSQFAVELLRADLALPPVSPASNGHSAVEPAASADVDATLAPSGEAAAAPPATAPMNRLAELLKRQLELAADPAREGEYMAVVAEISTLQ